MSAYWLAQGVGVIAFLIGITTFINRDESASSSSFPLQRHHRRAFLSDGRTACRYERELNAVRTIISMHTRKLWVMAVFIADAVFWFDQITPPGRAAADYWHGCQYLGAVSLQRAFRALRHVVFNRLLGHA
jgi:hypothetical protein